MTIVRNGLQQMIRYTRLFCKVYNSFAPAAMAFIDSREGYTTEQKNAAKSALTAVVDACHALDIFYKIYEA